MVMIRGRFHWKGTWSFSLVSICCLFSGCDKNLVMGVAGPELTTNESPVRLNRRAGIDPAGLSPHLGTAG